jgi:hypothetical protein
MNSIKAVTALLIILLVILTVVSICLLIKNKRIIKETFFVSNHNCPPYTYDHSGKNSYFSKSKGWCATAAFEDEVTQSGDYNQPGSYNQSSIKCPPTHYRVPGKISMETESKTWCLKSE